jgi:hypothetical protein
MRGKPIYTTTIPILVVRERALAEKRADLDQELKPLGLRIVNADRGFAIADTDGNIVQRGTEFSPTMTLNDVQMWIRRRALRRARSERQ